MLTKSPPTSRILDVSDLWAGYGATPILQGVTMSVSRGEIVGVIGRNGVGKSTLMRCLIGLLQTWRGTISFMEQDVTALEADARARAGFGNPRFPRHDAVAAGDRGRARSE